jgi:hypothetical protein
MPDLSQIDWKQTGILAGVVAAGLLGVVVAWKLSKLLLRLALFGACLLVIGATLYWWFQVRR